MAKVDKFPETLLNKHQIPHQIGISVASVLSNTPENAMRSLFALRVLRGFIAQIAQLGSVLSGAESLREI